MFSLNSLINFALCIPRVYIRSSDISLSALVVEIEVSSNLTQAEMGVW